MPVRRPRCGNAILLPPRDVHPGPGVRGAPPPDGLRWSGGDAMDEPGPRYEFRVFAPAPETVEGWRRRLGLEGHANESYPRALWRILADPPAAHR